MCSFHIPVCRSSYKLFLPNNDTPKENVAPLRILGVQCQEHLVMFLELFSPNQTSKQINM